MESSTIKRWPDPQNIPVCWVNPSDASSEIKDSIKASVFAEYHMKTNVRFIGWGTCTAQQLKQAVIRIHFQKIWNWSGKESDKGGGTGGGVSRVGPSVENCGQGSTSGHICEEGTMNFKIGSRGTYPKDASYYSKAFNVTNSMALHELGHALGLAHEHSRQDATCNDQAYSNEYKDNGTNFIFVGKYDEDSIMNYCRNRTTELRLTTTDVATPDRVAHSGNKVWYRPKKHLVLLVLRLRQMRKIEG